MRWRWRWRQDWYARCQRTRQKRRCRLILIRLGITLGGQRHTGVGLTVGVTGVETVGNVVGVVALVAGVDADVGGVGVDTTGGFDTTADAEVGNTVGFTAGSVGLTITVGFTTGTLGTTGLAGTAVGITISPSAPLNRRLQPSS